MECKGLELKNTVCSGNKKVPSGTGTEEAGEGSRQVWAGEMGRNQRPQGQLCQSSV